MATRIVVPDAGQTTDEMLLERWRVAVGDVVASGDIVADIETDKATMELESYAAGTVLELLSGEGDLVVVGQALLVIGQPGETAAEAAPPTEPTARQLATPAARTTAREHGLELAGITGSGPEGCIVKRDVAAGEARRPNLVPLSPMRRAIGARLQQSVREAPHFYVAIEVDLTVALAVREAIGEVSINDLILKATADTLASYPRVNCRLEGEDIVYLDAVHLGIAVGVEDGLVVPAMAHADRLTLRELAAEARRLIADARAGRLPSLRGSFTVSNLGMYGVKSFTAIINPPEAAILGVGAVLPKLMLTDRGIVAAPTVELTLSSDHRVLDGVIAAEFLQALRQRLENPAAWSTG